jgi:Zn finger protein HypA/HybF involved in hydrogenase expression
MLHKLGYETTCAHCIAPLKEEEVDGDGMCQTCNPQAWADCQRCGDVVPTEILSPADYCPTCHTGMTGH